MPSVSDAARKRIQTISEFTKRCQTDPLLFVLSVFDWDRIKSENDGLHSYGLEDWQREALIALGKLVVQVRELGSGSVHICCLTAKNVGKTALYSMVSVWKLCCFEDSKILLFANTRSQAQNVGATEIWKWLLRTRDSFPYKEMFDHKVKSAIKHKTRPGWWARTEVVSRTNPEASQGHHAPNILGIREEFGGWTKRALEHTDSVIRANKGAIMIDVGNFNRDKKFHAAHEIYHEAEKDSLAFTKKVTAYDVSFANLRDIEKHKKLYGEDSDAFRVYYLALPPRVGADAVYPSLLLENAMKRSYEQKLFENSPVCMGVDLSLGLGQDNTAFFIYQGKKVLDLFMANDLSTTWEVCHLIFEFAKKHGVSHICIERRSQNFEAVYAAVNNDKHRHGIKNVTWYEPSKRSVKKDLKVSEKIFYNYRTEMCFAFRSWLEDGGSLVLEGLDKLEDNHPRKLSHQNLMEALDIIKFQEKGTETLLADDNKTIKLEMSSNSSPDVFSAALAAMACEDYAPRDYNKVMKKLQRYNFVPTI